MKWLGIISSEAVHLLAIKSYTLPTGRPFLLRSLIESIIYGDHMCWWIATIQAQSINNASSITENMDKVLFCLDRYVPLTL